MQSRNTVPNPKTDTRSLCQISISRCLTTLSPEDRHILFPHRVAAETLRGVQWCSYDLCDTAGCTEVQLRFVGHCRVYRGAATICGTLQGVQRCSYNLWDTAGCTEVQLQFVGHCRVYRGAATICGTLQGV
jgi:hypothetical protein